MNDPASNLKSEAHQQMRLLLERLMAIGIVGAAMSMTSSEHTRLRLSLDQARKGESQPENITRLVADLSCIAADAALLAQGAVSRAASAPENPCHR